MNGDLRDSDIPGTDSRLYRILGKRLAEEEDKRRQELAGRLASWSRESAVSGSKSSGQKSAAAETDGGRDLPDANVQKATAGGAGMDRQVVRSKWPPRRLALYGAGAFFGLAVVYQLMFGDHSTRLNVQTERITISTVTRGPFQEFIPVRGEVLPILTIFLDAQESGRVEEVYLEAGAMVEKGQPILKLSNPSLELQVMNQETMVFDQLNSFEQTRISLEQQGISLQQQLLQMEQEVTRQEQDFALQKELLKKGLISERQYDREREDFNYWRQRLDFMRQTVHQDSLARRLQLQKMKSMEARLQRTLDAGQESLANLTLSAPVTGQLTSLDAEVGQLKNRGERFGQVDVLDGFKVRAQIDEFYITRIRPGQAGTFDLREQSFDLVIRRVYPEVVDGRFEVDLEFAGDVPTDIRRGQTLQIRLALGDLSEALLLERGGFYRATGGNWVFVVDKSGGAASRRSIRIGRQNPEYFEVLEGLVAGERVVTSSYDSYVEIERLVLQ